MLHLFNDAYLPPQAGRAQYAWLRIKYCLRLFDNNDLLRDLLSRGLTTEHHRYYILILLLLLLFSLLLPHVLIILFFSFSVFFSTLISFLSNPYNPYFSFFSSILYSIRSKDFFCFRKISNSFPKYFFKKIFDFVFYLYGVIHKFQMDYINKYLYKSPGGRTPIKCSLL